MGESATSFSCGKINYLQQNLKNTTKYSSAMQWKDNYFNNNFNYSFNGDATILQVS